jgi:hypothetical protein
MELAYQWDMLEDEVLIVFDNLLQSIKRQLLNLKSFMRGESMKVLENLEDSTNYHRALSEHGFVPTLVEGIDFRIQDIEYKFSLAQQGFAREVKYGGVLFTSYSVVLLNFPSPRAPAW